MSDVLNKISDVFRNYINYDTVNNFSDKKLRNARIPLVDFISFRFLYTDKNATHESITSKLNDINDTNFTRQAYVEKEKYIPVEFYEHLLNKIIELANNSLNPKQQYIDNNEECENNDPEYQLLGVDGVYNTGPDRIPILNLGLFNITQNVPLDIEYEGEGNRNKEIKVLTEYIKNNIDEFKKYILVADRAYHSHDFFNFLIENNIKFVIRAKGNGNTLNSKKKLNSGLSKKNRDLIKKIRRNVRVIKSKKSYNKSANISKSKKSKNIIQFKQESNYTLITNLKNRDKYSNNSIIEYYKSRWDIEVFFKHIKYNFKFQNLDEKDQDQYKKLYICELILMHIVKFIENEYIKNHKEIFNEEGLIKSINKSNLIKGIFDTRLIIDLITGNVTEKSYKSICKYIVISINEKGRSFPRSSKTPFSKWYIKDYSERTKYARIINAIINEEVNKLPKNLKTLAQKIKIMTR